ncbi:MAG: hypothetical protein V4736_10710 [Bdellovibrionota bacterium]
MKTLAGNFEIKLRIIFKIILSFTKTNDLKYEQFIKIESKPLRRKSYEENYRLRRSYYGSQFYL